MYTIIVYVIYFLIIIVNGRVKVFGEENLPPREGEKFVLVAPHRSFLDPVFIAIASHPRKFMYMGKKEIFEIPVVSWLAKQMNAFPVDRENPGVSAIKHPVKHLKNDDLSLVIFPTGTRYSDQMKGGAVTIARMSKKPIVPAVYLGPLTIKELFTRRQTTVIYGKPFYIERKIEGVKDLTTYYNDKIQAEFEALEAQISKE